MRCAADSLEAVGLERGVHLDAVAGSLCLAAEDEHNGGVAVRPAWAEARAEKSVGRAFVDDTVAVKPDAVAAAEGCGRCALRYFLF